VLEAPFGWRQPARCSEDEHRRSKYGQVQEDEDVHALSWTITATGTTTREVGLATHPV
jgi:hypothetical protein